MKKNKRESSAVKLVLSAMVITVISWASVIAKAADLQVYSIFSENVEVADVTKLIPIENEFVDKEEFDYPFVEDVEFVNEKEMKHQHSYVDAKLQEHKKNKDGSCKVTIYNARKCTVCNKYLKDDVDTTLITNPCRH